MALQEEAFVFKDNLIRNRSIYPDACGIAPSADVVYHPYRKTSSAKYLRESRPKPKSLLSNMTPRPYVYTVDDKRGEYWQEYSQPCPHNGIHGNVVVQAFTTDVLNWGDRSLFPEYFSLKDKNLWAGPLRDKVGNQQVNLGSSLAEYRESCKMFVGFAKGMWNAYRSVRGKRRRKPITVRDIPASVLAFNFGVAPLANDLYSSIEMLKTRMEKPLIRRFSGSVFRGRETTCEVGPHQVQATGAFRQRATIYANLNTFAGLHGDFDLGNPIEWAWELIPFSFVVDWGIPIGEYLGRLDAMIGVQFLSGTVVTKTWTKAQYHPSLATHVVNDGVFSSKSYEREVIDTVPMAAPPAWNPSMSYKRVINATSLLWLLKGRIGR